MVNGKGQKDDSSFGPLDSHMTHDEMNREGRSEREREREENLIRLVNEFPCKVSISERVFTCRVNTLLKHCATILYTYYTGRIFI